MVGVLSCLTGLGLGMAVYSRLTGRVLRSRCDIKVYISAARWQVGGVRIRRWGLSCPTRYIDGW